MSMTAAVTYWQARRRNRTNEQSPEEERKNRMVTEYLPPYPAPLTLSYCTDEGNEIRHVELITVAQSQGGRHDARHTQNLS